jgi:hypothetical protein
MKKGNKRLLHRVSRATTNELRALGKTHVNIRNEWPLDTIDLIDVKRDKFHCARNHMVLILATALLEHTDCDKIIAQHMKKK